MDLNLSGKVVIITGGAKGIGFAIAESLAAEKAIPVIVGRKEADNKKALEKLGGKGYQIVAELTKPEECKAAVEQVVSKFGRIDGLVNNAGVNDGVGLANGDYNGFLASLHKNVIHYYLMGHYCLPYLKTSKGAIVNIGSKVAETGQGNTSGYAASNGGRNALTREWAVELLPFSIRVNAVIVAESYTPLYETWSQSFANPEEKLKEISDKIPLEKRMTFPREIADTVVFLLSNRSGHTTGQLIHVDGGYVHLDRAIR